MMVHVLCEDCVDIWRREGVEPYWKVGLMDF